MVSGAQYKAPSSPILQLVDGRWVQIGSTSCGSYMEKCLVVCPSPDKMIIVGETNTIEECVVV